MVDERTKSAGRDKNCTYTGHNIFIRCVCVGFTRRVSITILSKQTEDSQRTVAMLNHENENENQPSPGDLIPDDSPSKSRAKLTFKEALAALDRVQKEDDEFIATQLQALVDLQKRHAEERERAQERAKQEREKNTETLVDMIKLFHEHRQTTREVYVNAISDQLKHEREMERMDKERAAKDANSEKIKAATANKQLHESSP